MKKRPKKTPARKRATALVRVRGTRAMDVLPKAGLTPLQAVSLTTQVLGPDPTMSATFVGTLKLTPEQIAALRRPVADGEIEWKPVERDGPPVIPYLSHNGYRDRLDAAFGLGGWGMVPVGMPREKEGSIFTPYALVIDGVPRVYAWGEQQLHKMTYGDGLEGAKSNAIVRCGKELGIARELWSRQYLEELKARRQSAGSSRRSEPRSAAAPEPVRDLHADEPISLPQRKRFFAIAKSMGREKAELAVWLAARWKVTSSALITRGIYNLVIAELEKPGPLNLQAIDGAD